MNSPFVRRFREEREQAVILAVDVSGSMPVSYTHLWAYRAALTSSATSSVMGGMASAGFSAGRGDWPETPSPPGLSLIHIFSRNYLLCFQKTYHQEDFYQNYFLFLNLLHYSVF